jgi:hypothetical protein
MTFRYDEIMQAQAAHIDAQQQLAAADLEAARVTDDAYGVRDAADRILNLDLMRNALNARAQTYFTSQAAQSQSPGSRWGLSDEEVAVAKASHSAGTDEQRIEEYARNKQRYWAMRASGEYDDSQGSVRRR